MKKFKIALITLFIVSLIFGGVVAYCYATRSTEEEFGIREGMNIRATLIEEPENPDEYIPLANPDKWTLKAIENLGEYVHVDIQGECRASAHIKYDGQYYDIDFLFADFPAEEMEGIVIPPNSSPNVTVVNASTTPRKVLLQDKVLTYAPASFSVLAALWIVLGVVWFKAEKNRA